MNIRTTRPEAGNKYFITRGRGGYSGCIVGSPTDSKCNVLSNCVGYANGAINEEKGAGKEVYPLTCNAENFIERGIAYGLSVYKSPEVGDCLVWQKGSTLGGSDGAGHVAICIAVLERNADGTAKKIRTAESGYGSSNPFWTTTRTNVNGKWGAGANYYYRGSLRIPGMTPTPTPTPIPTPGPSDKFNIGDKVVANGDLYTSSNASSPAGHVTNKVTTITRKNPGSAHPYNTTGDLGWMNESSLTKYTEPTPTPAPTPTPTPSSELKVGDTVKITGTGKASSYGTGATAGGIGWTRQILKVYPGRAYPYQVGNSTGTTGFYKKSALKKI